ncbi:hypothetical protein SPSIL_017130 [Sporomusa silvacetica DSM 10669]|uniref:Uncharacterized protein n=1 Tax=Sporomusa silvacetica DSM 10669 TaxID=1123289 RepID=A0ABZ3IJH9_9FIRM|nr:hypothetical protein [Sporomusa silvacetica]OZC18366.1 hypothetical protein SPSIL_25660 [Sporomusa silvacetica DSM 10669]
MHDSILVSPVGGEFLLTVNISGHCRTYSADSLEAAQKRAERLCYILDLSPSIIQYWKPKSTLKRQRTNTKKAISNYR